MSDGSVSRLGHQFQRAPQGPSRRNARAIAVLSMALTLSVAGPADSAVACPASSRQFCAGDCDGNSQVTVDELLTLVNIALGKAPVAACQNGAPSGATVTVAWIVQAVSNVLTGCAEHPICGDGVVEGGEECDQGGICIGNARAGHACRSEADCCATPICGGPADGGVCAAGPKLGAACTNDADCPSGACVRCKPFGGNGCAANCTAETDVVLDLLPGQIDLTTGVSVLPGTSGCVVHGSVLTVPLPIGNGCEGGANPGAPCSMDSDCGVGGVCTPATQTFKVGKDCGDGIVPLVVKADSVKFPRIDVGGLACACIRGVALQTCGGTVFEPDGVTPTTSCTAGYGTCDGTQHCANAPSVSCTVSTDCEGAALCSRANGLPCAPVHGAGNSATGFAGCGSTSLTPVNYNESQNAGGCADPPACTSRTPKPAVVTWTGIGPAGSAVVLNTTAIGTAVGACTGTDPSVYGPDGRFCTDDDPPVSRGSPQTAQLTTGQACAAVTNANFSLPNMPIDITGICHCTPNTLCASDADCAGVDSCVPICASGTPFSCSALAADMFPGGCLANAFVSLGQPTTGDLVVSCQFCPVPTEPPVPFAASPE